MNRAKKKKKKTITYEEKDTGDKEGQSGFNFMLRSLIRYWRFEMV